MFHDYLGDFLVVKIRCHDAQTMLHGAGGNPDVICRDRGSSLAKEVNDHRISFGCFLRNVDKPHPWGRRENLKLALVFPESIAGAEPCPELPKNNGIEDDFIGLLQRKFHLGVPFHESRICRRVQHESHYIQISLSIFRWSARLLSKAAASFLVQAPASSSKSW